MGNIMSTHVFPAEPHCEFDRFIEMLDTVVKSWINEWAYLSERDSYLSQHKPRKSETANRKFSLLCPTKMCPFNSPNSNNFSYSVCSKDSLKAAIVNIISNMNKNHMLSDFIENVTETEGVFIEYVFEMFSQPNTLSIILLQLILFCWIFLFI